MVEMASEAEAGTVVLVEIEVMELGERGKLGQGLVLQRRRCQGVMGTSCLQALSLCNLFMTSFRVVSQVSISREAR